MSKGKIDRKRNRSPAQARYRASSRSSINQRKRIAKEQKRKERVAARKAAQVALGKKGIYRGKTRDQKRTEIKARNDGRIPKKKIEKPRIITKNEVILSALLAQVRGNMTSNFQAAA